VSQRAPFDNEGNNDQHQRPEPAANEQRIHRKQNGWLRSAACWGWAKATYLACNYTIIRNYFRVPGYAVSVPGALAGLLDPKAAKPQQLCCIWAAGERGGPSNQAWQSTGSNVGHDTCDLRP